MDGHHGGTPLTKTLSEDKPGRPAARIGVWLGAILAIGIVGYLLLGRSEPVANSTGGPDAIPVVLAPVARQDVPIYLDGLGTVTALNAVTLHARVDGSLDKVTFTEGQDVHAGDLLAQIDPRPFQAALDAAQAKKAQDMAQLANAKRDLDRYSALTTKQYATQQSVDTQQAMVAQLEAAIKGDDAQIETAQVQLGYTRITAPIDGRIGLRQIDPGNIVHASDATGLAMLTQVRPIAIVFTLPADDIGDVRKAMKAGPVKVEALSHDGKESLGEGTLLTIDDMIDAASATIRLKAIFEDADGALWPGQFVSIRLLAGTRMAAMTVPAAAVQRGPDGYFVFTVGTDQSVKSQPVEVAQMGDELAVISKGLTDRDQVVTNGQSRLVPGVHVTIANDTGAAKPVK